MNCGKTATNTCIIMLRLSLAKPRNSASYHILHSTRTHCIITHYKRMGYVIFPKPIFSRRGEGINYRCRRLVVLLFAVLPQSGRRYNSSCRGSDGSLAINRDQRRWFIQHRFQLNTRAATRFHESVWLFFVYKKNLLLGRTEMRTRERKDRQLICLRYLPR